MTTPYAAQSSQYPGEQGAAADFGEPNMRFAVPPIDRDGPWNDEQGWAPNARIGIGTTPDAMRVGMSEQRWFYPRGSEEEPGPFYEQRDAEEKSRHANEYQDADGLEIGKARYRSARNPRENPPPESRITGSLSPHSYVFTRPYDQFNRQNGIGSARHLNGTHFSMADHRRDFPILGMKPPGELRRNTYRIEPIPWDTDVVDTGPVSSYLPQARVGQSEIASPGSYGSYRLG